MTITAYSETPLWGQAWEIDITYATGDDTYETLTASSTSWTPEGLRVTFDIMQTTLPSPWWFADINLYNLNEAAFRSIQQGATWVTLKAGFQIAPGLYSQVWSGPVLQALYTREGVVDEKINLHCVANPLASSAISNISTGPGSSQAFLIQQLAKSVGLNISYGAKATTALAQVAYPRGRGVFGKPMKYMAQIADSHFMSAWQDGQQAYLSEIQNSDLTPDLIYTPPTAPGNPGVGSPLAAGVTASIIGTPRQIPQGVEFTVLLDPRLAVQLPPLVVQLQDTLITQLQTTPGQSLVAPLPANLTFFVAQVRHSGDTRGNEWQTDVTGYSTAYADNLLNGVFSANGGM